MPKTCLADNTLYPPQADWFNEINFVNLILLKCSCPISRAVVAYCDTPLQRRTLTFEGEGRLYLTPGKQSFAEVYKYLQEGL